MNFNEAVKYISDAAGYGIIPGLDSIRRLCSRLSDPQEKLKIIHIAGTNGKGSAGTFIQSILSEAGYSTGRFVTPAVMDYLEIIQYNGRSITEDEFAGVVSRVKDAAESLVSEGFPHPTVFELQTAAAFCYFEEMKCDIVLLEAGMGGRTDATNIITESELSVITSISLEHTMYLGDTLEKIASEKGGIIKPRGSAVTISQNPEVTNTLINICSRQKAELTIAKIYNISDYSCSDGIQTFTYQQFRDLKISLLGKFQTENAVLAAEACLILSKKGWCISEEHIRKGLAGAVWPGRFEVIRKSSPVIVIDGAHNPSAAARLRETIDICFSERNITYITGCFKDKNYKEIARITSKRARKIYTVTTEGSRSLDAEELAEAIRPYNSNVTAASSPEEAVARCIADKCEIVIAFGSLSFLSRIKNYLNKEKEK